jgi:hypothetical protein
MTGERRLAAILAADVVGLQPADGGGRDRDDRRLHATMLRDYPEHPRP